MKSSAQRALRTPGVPSISARKTHYRELNRVLRQAVLEGAREVELHDVLGQRYLGTNIRRPVRFTVLGTPGNDLGAFMDGPVIEVFGNAQDGVGNTMNSGEIVIHGSAGDVLAMSMRGGSIFVKGNVGYRCAIHMKQYADRQPLVVIGGTAQDFFGEYMAGGTVILFGLGLPPGERHRMNFVGTGMHAGRIFLRGSVLEEQLGKEVGVVEPDASDREVIEQAVRRYCAHFGADAKEILSGPFTKLYPRYLRPYGQLYAY